VAQSGKDYTVYAYDYSEHETPLVGQGMLSWLLASSSPALEAPAHQSTTMVPGRVCKIPLGIFSEGAQETLEVRLQLVPVPAIMQSEYFDIMQTHRELSNVIPRDFDAKSRKRIVRQTPAESCANSSAKEYGIEKFHQLLSEGSIPRGLTPFPPNQSVRSVSPPQPCAAHNRVSTLCSSRMTTQLLPRSEQNTPHIDVIPPSSSASMRDSDFQTHVSYNPRRGPIQPGYCSGRGELVEPQPRKKAKVHEANWPRKLDMNMNRRPSSLLVAACIPASVRIHRPTTVNPVVVTEQSAEEPPRPPIPISQSFDLPPQGQPSASIASCSTSYTPYFMRDGLLTADLTGHSPEDFLRKSLCDPSFTMLSSPPFIHGDFSNRPGPVLLPISLETSSGFLSGDSKNLSEEGTTAPLNYCATTESCYINRNIHNVRTAVQVSSLASAIGLGQGASRHPLPVSGTPKEQTSKKAQAPPSRPATSTGSRPPSSAGARVAPTPPALAILQSDVQIVSEIPASDFVVSIHHPVNLRFSPCTTGSTERSKQVQARLDQAIRKGQVPPYCENCGSIETPTWRRAWSKDVEGSEKVAEAMMRDSSRLFWLALEHNAQGEMQKFKIYKKGSGETVSEWTQMLFCNPCGLWLYRIKSMRPEKRWNLKLLEKKKKGPLRNHKTGPFSSCPASRTRSKAASNKPLASSPAPTEMSFIPTKEEIPNMSNTHDNDDEADASPHIRRREISAEPRRLTYMAEHRWHEQHPMEDLQRAFQSNPARNMEVRLISRTDNKGLTPKHVRRSLSPKRSKGAVD
jgi:hypothetical protein